MKQKKGTFTYRELRELRQALIQAIDGQNLEQAAQLVARYPEDEALLAGEDLYLLGRVAEMTKATAQAEALFQRALADADLPAWCRGAAASSMAALLVRTARGEEAGPYFELSLSCKTVTSGWLEECSNALFYAHDAAEAERGTLARAQAYGAALAGIRPYRHARKRRHAKLRIGYVSADFCRHVVASFAYVLLHHYDHSACEVYCYMNGPEDGASAELQGWVTGWRNVEGQAYADIAAQIYKDEIDILFDLSGHTAGNLLPVFAYRPAPIQISGIGYFDTTGVPQMDYFLVDAHTMPEGEEASFTEQLLRLPHSHLCYMWHDKPGAVGPLPADGNGYITFGSLNNFAKVNSKTLALWAQVLHAVPGSRLLLKDAIFDDPYGTQCAMAKLAQAGIELPRLVTEGRTRDYLQAYERIDIALDTFPYPGGGTTCDALYMGVPVVTLAGRSHHARFGKSILENAGLPELVAATPEAYVQIAEALAADLPRLRTLRQTLRRRLRESPIMDAGSYLIVIEHQYQELYEHWLQGNETAAQRQKTARKLQEKLARAYEARDWERVILCGNRLRAVASNWQEYAGAIGRAYLNLPVPDFPRCTWFFAQADRTLPARQIEYEWLLGMGENRQRHHLRAQVHYERSDRACARYRQAQEQSSASFWDSPAFLTELHTQMAINELVMGRTREAAEHYLQASRSSVTLYDAFQMYGSYLMALHHLDIRPEAMLAAHEGINEVLREVQRYSHEGHPQHTRLRIGYISGDFRQHVMFYFYYQLLAGHDVAQFELYAYSLGETHDGFRELVRQAVDVFHDVHGWEMEAVARQIYEDEIDILVDLGGHSSGSGLMALAWKPAPVQVSGLGYMDTTGLAAVDYLITDAAADPIDAPCLLSERPLRLTSMFCYTGRTDVPPCQDAPCRRKGYVTFGVFNRYQKITDEMLALWQRIQARVPGSRLLCKAEAYHDDRLADLAYERFRAAGLDMERVTFEPSSSDYMARYLDVDIALDTYPYVGGGTTCDALYMGVPVITRYGAGLGSRFALSILTAAGLGELAVADGEAYVARAVGLAQDEELLSALHQNLRQMLFDSPLMDTQRYVREIEQAYQQIWREYLREREEKA